MEKKLRVEIKAKEVELKSAKEESERSIIRKKLPKLYYSAL
jgi:hypothetical protein